MSIIVISESTGDIITQASWEAITCARELSRLVDSPVTVVVAGVSIHECAARTASKTGLPVIGIESDVLRESNAEAYIDILTQTISAMNLRFVCLPHTASMGYDCAPALAVHLGASCITAVEKIQPGEAGPVFIRHGYGGKIAEHVIPARPLTVLTMLPGAWPPSKEGAAAGGSVRMIAADRAPQRTRTIGIREAPGGEGMDLQKADTIVAAGRGVGKEEHLPLIHTLAGTFPKSSVGASRGACDLGWFGYGRQIGVTGQTVSPRLYIACGISGAIQHISGMKGSQVVVAVNTDRKAPIFAVADYCIVDDLARFIPAFLDVCRAHHPFLS